MSGAFHTHHVQYWQQIDYSCGAIDELQNALDRIQQLLSTSSAQIAEFILAEIPFDALINEWLEELRGINDALRTEGLTVCEEADWAGHRINELEQELEGLAAQISDYEHEIADLRKTLDYVQGTIGVA